MCNPMYKVRFYDKKKLNMSIYSCYLSKHPVIIKIHAFTQLHFIRNTSTCIYKAMHERVRRNMAVEVGVVDECAAHLTFMKKTGICVLSNVCFA